MSVCVPEGRDVFPKAREIALQHSAGRFLRCRGRAVLDAARKVPEATALDLRVLVPVARPRLDGMVLSVRTRRQLHEDAGFFRVEDVFRTKQKKTLCHKLPLLKVLDSSKSQDKDDNSPRTKTSGQSNNSSVARDSLCGSWQPPRRRPSRGTNTTTHIAHAPSGSPQAG